MITKSLWVKCFTCSKDTVTIQIHAVTAGMLPAVTEFENHQLNQIKKEAHAWPTLFTDKDSITMQNSNNITDDGGSARGQSSDE